MSSVITTTGSNSLVDPQAQRLGDLLRDVGLPHDSIMADPSERSIIASNLPGYLNSLPAEVKCDARYLSKFTRRPSQPICGPMFQTKTRSSTTFRPPF